MVYSQTTATKKLSSLRKRIRGVSGGTSASKTISILMLLIDYAATHKNELISVVSESFPHLKRGAIRDFLNIMEGNEYFNAPRWNKTDFVYTFDTGCRIEFFSADQPGKVRGPRREVLFINEANNISLETFTQLEIRTKKIVWLDWNPVSEFWFYTDVMPYHSNLDFLILTYRDNEALEKAIVQTIESRKGNKNWWAVYGEGLLGEAEGRIYKEWAIIDEVPHEAALRRYGLDFGYTNDPSAIVAIYYHNGGYVLDEVAYQYGMTNKDISDLLKNQNRALIIADSAEPKSIDEIKMHGLNIIGSQKGKGSVNQGIQFVQQQRVSVTKRSLNIIKEYRNYLWIVDKDGKIVNEPQDFLNHAMDATRYGMDSFRPMNAKPRPMDFGGIKPYFPGIDAPPPEPPVFTPPTEHGGTDW